MTHDEHPTDPARSRADADHDHDPTAGEGARLASIRLITRDPGRLARFYEVVTGVEVRWLTDDFGEVSTPSATVAVSHPRRLAFLGDGAVRPGASASSVVEFLVDDVDAVHGRSAAALCDAGGEVVQEPTTMPWGNRSLLLRDPDGTLVNLYAPVTPEARELQRLRR